MPKAIFFRGGMALKSYVVRSLPSGEEYSGLVSAFLGSQLMILNDFSRSTTSIITDDPHICTRMRSCSTGFDYLEEELPIAENPTALVIFPPETSVEADPQSAPAKLFGEICNLLAGQRARLYISLVKADPSHLQLVKARVEGALSQKEIRVTKSSGSRGSPSHSLQSDLFYGSGERRCLTSLLNMLNQTSIVNGSAYKVLFVIDGDTKLLLSYLNSKISILNFVQLKSTTIASLYHEVRGIDAIPFSYDSLSRLLVFSERIQRSAKIKTIEPNQRLGGVEIGNFLKDSVSESPSKIRIEESTLNLGAIITGLPGTGKTLAAMSILSKLRASKVVISPTKEWGEFARLHNLHLIKIYNSSTPINFFRCTDARLKDKFSENLAMLIASASSAGPYQSSMEKCLLAAFRRVYSKELCPDPVELYHQVEEVLIEQHAKRSSTGVKYTKHGENIKAALENLRLVLFRPEFAATVGVDLNEIFRAGVVFDLSDVGSKMKQFLYALILNQLYAFLDSFDERGNEQLRIEIALEEAQLIFSPDEISPVVADLRQRIQDFRKRGIGLMLITHSITDITPSIRRLCQSKLYFRQSADVAKYALTDLGLDAADPESLSRIRGLEQGCCALLYLEKEGQQKLPRGPIFIKVNTYEEVTSKLPEEKQIPVLPNLVCNTTFKLLNAQKSPVTNKRLELSYLGEPVENGFTNSLGELEFINLIQGKMYLLKVPGEKKKDSREYQIIAFPRIELTM